MRCCIYLLLGVSGIMAQPPKVDQAAQIQEWLSQLDHPRYRVREQATKNLQDAGRAAAKPLFKVARHGSSEASDRAMRILAFLADSPDPQVEEAARSVLRQIADVDAPLAREAIIILGRRRAAYLYRLQQAGAQYVEDPSGNLRELSLDHVKDVASILALLREFPELEDLSISNSAFTGGMAAHLAPMRNLRSLNLFESSMDDDGLKHLLELPNLKHLPMGQSRITDAGLKTIGKMTQLTYVGVRGNNVTDAGLMHLKEMVNLTGLNIAETKVTDAGLKHLAPLTRLTSLYLYGTSVSDAGLELLYDFNKLEYLSLNKTKTTSAGRKRLAEALPGLHIASDAE